MNQVDTVRISAGRGGRAGAVCRAGVAAAGYLCAWAGGVPAGAAPLLAQTIAPTTQAAPVFPDLDAQRPPGNIEVLRTVATTSRLLLISSLLFLVFAMATYLLLRRPGREPGKRRNRTEYVDAWARYRLSDESIAAATAEEPPEARPTGEDDDPQGRPPRPPRD